MPIPTVGKTIAIILGASEFNQYKTLDPSPAFLKSAEDFRKYLRSYHGLRLPDENISFLFNRELHPGEVISAIRNFIEDRCKVLNDVTDVIFYYCGHGGYLHEDEYFLALDVTDKFSKEATVFKISYLRDIVADLTRDKRNLIVLDACYSGAALTEFVKMSDDEKAPDLVSAQLLPRTEGEQLLSQTTGAAVPRDLEMASQGIVLFCAAGAKKWAKTPLEGTYTMFTGALLQVLDNGDQKAGPFFTLAKMASLVNQGIRSAFGSQAVQLQIHVPVQTEHDILQSPYFPNPAFDVSDFETRMTAISGDMQTIRDDFTRFQNSFPTVVNSRVRQAIDAAGINNPPTGGNAGPERRPLRSPWSAIDDLVPGLAAVITGFAIDGFSLAVLKISSISEDRPTDVARASGDVHQLTSVLLAVMILHFLLIGGSAMVKIGLHRAMQTSIAAPPPSFVPYRPGLVEQIATFFPRRFNYSVLLWNSVFVLMLLVFLALMGHDTLRDILMNLR